MYMGGFTMGKIITEGKAGRLVKYDTLTTNITFRANKRQTGVAIKTALDDCGGFLAYLKENGVDTGVFEAGSNSAEHSGYQSRDDVDAKRSLTARTGYDLKFVNYIMRAIEQNGYEADVSFSPGIRDIEEIKNELYTEAALRSKEKAEKMAEAMGMNVFSLKKMSEADTYGFHDDGDLCSVYSEAPELGSEPPIDKSYSELDSQQTLIEVRVEGEWKVE